MTGRRLRAAIVESQTFRQVARSELGRTVLRSPVRRAVSDLARRRAVSASRRRHPDLTTQLRTCFLMVGHTKSGGSLLGSMLDAHESIVCADELGLAQLLIDGGDVDAAVRLALRNTQRELDRGRVTSRRVEAYDLRVPDSHQGSVAGPPFAVGDSRAGPTTRYLADQPTPVSSLQELLSPVELRLLHIVRNPFDPIAFMVVRGRRTPTDAISDYAGQCARVEGLLEAADGMVHRVRYEDLVSDPGDVVEGVCRFLDVAVDAAYLDACRGLVRSVRPERHRIDWSPADISRVEAVIGRYGFLKGYSFEVEA